MTSAATSPTDDPRLRLYPRAVAGAVLLSFVFFLVSSSGSEAVSGRVGGDFPAFYAAGNLVMEDPVNLYDVEAQTDQQVDLLGSKPEGSLLYFAYPPYVALLYAPLAMLPYTAAYALHTALMVALVVAALWQLRPMIGLLDRWFEQAVLASIFFFPMFRGITGGQTTALVLFLVATGIRAFVDRRDVLAGLAFAGILFKPQYALAFLGVSILVGRWRVAISGAVGTVGLYLVGAAVSGWGWLGPWVEQVRWFTRVDAEVNAANSVSWLGSMEALLGAGSTPALLIGWPLAVASVALMAWVWWRDGGQRPALLLALSIPAVLLAAPHAMFYDVGLLVAPLLILADREPRWRVPVVVLYGLGFIQLTASTLGVSPLIVVPVATLVLSVALLRRPTVDEAASKTAVSAPSS